MSQVVAIQRENERPSTYGRALALSGLTAIAIQSRDFVASRSEAVAVARSPTPAGGGRPPSRRARYSSSHWSLRNVDVSPSTWTFFTKFQ